MPAKTKLKKYTINNLGKTVDQLGVKFDKMQGDMTKIEIKQINMEVDIKEIKNTMATKDDLTGFKSEILGAVDEIKQKFDKHATEHKANLAAHDRIQRDVNQVRKHLVLGIKNPV